MRDLRSGIEESGESPEPHVNTRGYAALQVRCLRKQLQDGKVFGTSQVEAQHGEDPKLLRVRHTTAKFSGLVDYTKLLFFSCDKKFFFPRDLKTHMKQHGADSRSYICTHCGRGFLNASVLKEHTRIRHTGERPFPCDQCERSYFRKRELVEHQRSHTGEKPFCCEVCNRIYARKTTLMTHMKTHR